MKNTICLLLLMMMTNIAFSEQGTKAPYYLSNQQLDESLQVDAKTPPPDRFIRLVYFHRVPGCQTCQKMSQFVYQTVQNRFSEQVKNKSLVLRYINFEDPKFALFAQTFKVNSPTLIAIEVRKGKDVRYWNLNQIWPLSADKAKFEQYIESELKKILEPENEQ